MTAIPTRHRQVDALTSQITLSQEDKILVKVLKQHSEESYNILRCLADFRGFSFAYPAGTSPNIDEERDRKSASKLTGMLGGTWRLHYGTDVHFFIVPSKQLASPIILGSKLTLVERAVHIHQEGCRPTTCPVMKDTPWIPGTKEFAYAVADKYLREWKLIMKNLQNSGKPVKQLPTCLKSVVSHGKEQSISNDHLYIFIIQEITGRRWTHSRFNMSLGVILNATAD